MKCIIPLCQSTCNDDENKLCKSHLTTLTSNYFLHRILNMKLTTHKIQNAQKVTHLVLLQKGSNEYQEVANKFLHDWIKPNAQGIEIEAIYTIFLPFEIMSRYNTYKKQVETRINYKSIGLSEANEKLLWHGTDHTCSILHNAIQSNLCSSNNCPGCGVLMNSFLLSKVGVNYQGRTFQRLGQGIYFTPYSSKAHFYGHGGAKPLPREAGRTCRIMFLSKVTTFKVILGNPWQPEKVSQNATSPPSGFDSTWGRVGYCPHGGAMLNYEEYAVYRQDACLPSNYVAYSYTSTSE
ncbi:hypothetical protein G9A89_017278 [Geosiphon pyriformis]|nr:hypothetical protein G9A89_017278 [Geosiphon pyriformis]